jgi:hypothetical protein
MITFYRDQLYEEVWTEPITRLAQKYGISDVGLLKITKKLNIPTPPRGYWAKVRYGKKVKRIPLPPLRHGVPDTYTFHPQPYSNRTSLLDVEVNKTFAAEIESAKKIIVPKRLVSPHPLVQQTQMVLSQSKPDKYGVLRPLGKYLDIRVAPGSLRRALRIMDSLLKWLELNNIPVEIVEDKTPSTYVHILGERIQFSLNEIVRRVEHTPSKEERKKKDLFSWYSAPRWDYIPTGKLRLEIKSWSLSGIRKIWSETESKSLEVLLKDFVSGLLNIAVKLREKRLIQEARERKLKKEKERLEQLERQRLAEEKRLQDLMEQARLWAKSQELRAYIKAVEKAAKDKNYLTGSEEQLKRWLTWAKEQADQLDPLQRGLPFEDKSFEPE